MSDEQAVQLIRSARDLAPGIPIMFNVLGEPFLNKKLFDYIALCEECGVEAALITNITLLTEERLRRLFQFSNVDLNLSLHTPTDKSFAERGYKKIASFREYLEMVCNTVEAKFRAGSKTGIEIYLSSELIENLMQNDGGSRLWTMYKRSRRNTRPGWEVCAERFTRLGAKIARDYPEAFSGRNGTGQREHAGQLIQAGELVFRAEDLPEWRLENQVSGWMCRTRSHRAAQGIRHVGVPREICAEARTAEPFRVSRRAHRTVHVRRRAGLRHSFGRNVHLCCQDVEGEMDIGNIATMDLRTAFDSPRREEIIANCATSRVCRRCAGNTMILDTQPIRDDWQTGRQIRVRLARIREISFRSRRALDRGRRKIVLLHEN